jgi:hypothetical protein
MKYPFIWLNNLKYVGCGKWNFFHLKYSFAATYDSAPEATAAIPTKTPVFCPQLRHCSSRQPNHEFSAFQLVGQSLYRLHYSDSTLEVIRKQLRDLQEFTSKWHISRQIASQNTAVMLEKAQPCLFDHSWFSIVRNTWNSFLKNVQPRVMDCKWIAI